jgi:hypothetical protein
VGGRERVPEGSLLGAIEGAAEGSLLFVQERAADGSLLCVTEGGAIQSKPVQAILPATGYNRNMPKAVVYGPRKCACIAVQHLFVLQGSSKIARQGLVLLSDGKFDQISDYSETDQLGS